VKIQHDIIAEIAGSVVPRYDAYLVDVIVRGERGETVLQILADTDSGISIGTCATISREIAAEIEQRSLIETRYRLEVSSPGLDKPLRLLRQYQTNKDRQVRVRWVDAEGEKTGDAVIAGQSGSIVSFTLADGSPLAIEFENIRECRHRLPW